MMKRAKIHRLLRHYMESNEATNVLEFISPVIKEADEDYIQEMVS